MQLNLIGRAVGVAAVLCLLGAIGARAESDDFGGTVSFQWENDRVAQTDRHYTNGVRLSWVSDKTTDGPDWARDLLEFMYPLAAVRGGRIGFALGQNMYTPEDTDAVALVADDRPYAGWLYGAVSLHAETTRYRGGLKLDVLDSVELNLGIVGPQAYGEDTQNNYHDLINVARSNGWSHQLKNEPALALFFERKWRPEPYRLAGLEVDAIPHVGGSLGNVFTLANVGATFRIGQFLDFDYGPPHIRPSLSGLEAVKGGKEFGWYLFAGGEGRAVLHNIFLDGNTFTDSHSVSKNPFVGSIQAGAVFSYAGYRVAFTHVYLTKEFGQQRRADRYGTISLSKQF
ncbi:MAG: DUF2219 family protein [Alphaproteobacteria bacterium]|nr:DUF2219 family protein [Alphaproteobacteria bacterium]